MTSDNQFLAVPSDFISPLSLSITNSSNFDFLLFKDIEFVQTYNPNPATTGVPKYYAQFDINNFVLAPTPNAGFTTTLSYFYRPTSITQELLILTVGASGSFSTTETITGGTSGVVTTISENAELTLLYGTLVEAYTFMKGEADMLSLYNNRFMESLSRLKNVGEAKEISDEYRTGQIMRQKT